MIDRMYRAGAKLSEIAAALPGRSKSGVSSRCKLLGLRRNRKRLTAEQEEHLIKLRLEHRMSYERMAEATGFEEDKVRYSIQRLVRAGRISRAEQWEVHCENIAARRRRHVD